MITKHFDISAAFTWSPQEDMFATGTNQLALFNLDTSLNKINTHSRMNTLAWGKNQIIAAGTDKENLEFYSVSNLLDHKSAEECLINTCHHPTKALDFSLVEPNNLALVGHQKDLSIWHLGQQQQPVLMPTSNKINNVSWNPKVQHILATCSTNGYTTVWDLRHNKEILNLMSKQHSISSIAWHPHDATQIIAASEDDDNPFISLWDLRQPQTPLKTFLKPTQKGIIDISWSQHDLLVSSSRDGYINCWNRGDFFYEIDHLSTPASIHWSFNSPLLATNTQQSIRLYSIPLHRPAGVAFGFGGKLASFKASSRQVKVSSVTTDTRLVQILEQLETISVQEFIQHQLDSKLNNEDWELLRILNSDHAREELVDYLKTYLEPHKTPKQVTVEKKNQLDINEMVKKDIVLGDFEAAVKTCIDHDRYSDAFMFAMCGGPELVKKTQKHYIQHKSKDHDYLILLNGLINRDLRSVIKQFDVEKEWCDVLILLCTFAAPDEFETLVNSIGNQNKNKLFYLAAGNVDKMTLIWKQDVDYLEKITIFKKIVQDTQTLAYQVANQNRLELALKYLDEGSALFHRVYYAHHHHQPIPAYPFDANPLRYLKLPPPSTMKYYSARQQ